LSDASAHNPLEMLEDKNIHGELSGLLSLLNDRELAIIEVRFGLNGNREPKTLDEVGTMFGITRERIRQLQNVALSKMSRGLKKVEKTSSTPANRNELISNVQSIIAILRAE
jgi:RNA polymerase primary sigma factor